MEFDYNISLPSEEAEQADPAKNRFLDSLGLGEESLVEAVELRELEEPEDQGVVLSSFPDGFDYLAAVSDETSESPLSLPSERALSEAPEVALANEPDLDAALDLECPQCHQALVLSRRHLGVEGSCVWCETPIVAVASGRDGAVRIFLVPQLSSEAAPSLMPSAERSVSEEESPLSPSVEELPTSSATMWAMPHPAGSEPIVETAHSTEEAPTGASAWAPEAVEAPSFEPPAEDEVSLSFVDLSAQDAPMGFGQPAGSSEPEAPKTEDVDPIVAQGFQPAPMSFTAMPAETAPSPSVGFDPPTPWGPPAPRAEHRPQMTEPADDDFPPMALPAGFTPAEAAPKETSSIPSWEAAFGSEKLSAEEPEKAPEVNPMLTPFDEDLPSRFGSAFQTGSAQEEVENSGSSNFGFQAGAELTPLFGVGSGDEPPAPLTIDVEASHERSSSTPASAADQPRVGNASNPWASPLTPPVEAKVDGPKSSLSERAVEGRGPEPVFEDSPFSTHLDGKPNPFTEATIDSFHPEPSTPESAEAPLPPSSESEAPVERVELSEAPAPKATLCFASLFKLKPNKGLIILGVVVMGFATGAALASFVLPVDQYVQAARSLMEEKFGLKEEGPKETSFSVSSVKSENRETDEQRQP